MARKRNLLTRLVDENYNDIMFGLMTLIGRIIVIVFFITVLTLVSK